MVFDQTAAALVPPGLERQYGIVARKGPLAARLPPLGTGEAPDHAAADALGTSCRTPGA